MKSQMPRFRFRDPNAEPKNRKKDFRKIQEKRKKKKYTDDGEIERLRKKLWPDFGNDKEDIQPADIKKFTDLPISKKTLQGLDTMRFTKPTDIQRESLLYALKGHDILGAAKTGSGKTLAFLIPILETLFHQRFTPSFGMAALVISPTRELAYQSYDVLRKLGKFHAFSVGLAIGGMFLREEAKKMYTTNVVICTPGRLLQHFEQTPNFTADELKVLVLDEADKILDMGFAETLNAIVEALPKQRQTLLFSATQTKSIKSLARLSLKKPIYVSVHEKAKEVTPTTLNQRYIVCDQQNKVNLLWSFIKSHKMKKMLVFLSSCKEVRYLYQAFKKMHPGLTILCLHGHMKQLQRMEAYELFSRKKNVVLLATDVAARGLDFPVIHWVVQVDKPENTDTYIHRVGRTARYEQVGEALLMLMPSEEEKMVEDLKKRKIPIVKLKVAKKRTFDITKRLESFCASDQDLKNNAQKAFISVMKTLYILDRATFHQVDVDAYAASMGLVQAPKLPFLNKTKTDKKKDKDDSSDNDEDDDESEEEAALKKRLHPGKKKTLDFSLGDDEEEEDDDIYNVVKASKTHLMDEEKDKEELQLVEEGKWTNKKKSSYKQKLKMLKQSKLITFDEEGNPEGKEEDDEDGEQGLNITKAVERLRQEDKIDKEVQRQRIKMEHREKRLKEKQKRREAAMARMGLTMEEGAAVLGTPDDDNNEENPDYGDDDEDEEGDDEEDESDAEEEESDDGDDEGPQAKRRKMDKEEESDNESDDDEEEEEDDNRNDFDNEDDDNEEENEDDDSDEDDMDDDEDDEAVDESEDEGRPENVEQDEAAVLALLGGKR